MRNRAFSIDSFDGPKPPTPSDPTQFQLIPTELQELQETIPVQQPTQASIPQEDTRFGPFSLPFYKLDLSILKTEAFSFLKESISLILSQAANLFIIL